MTPTPSSSSHPVLIEELMQTRIVLRATLRALEMYKPGINCGCVNCVLVFSVIHAAELILASEPVLDMEPPK